MSADLPRFQKGDRVIFRESESGPPEPGEITLVHDPDHLHPGGGEYEVDLDDGTNVVAWVYELTKEGRTSAGTPLSESD